MAERAAHLVDHVFPPVAVRQWVLSLPPRVRYLLAWDHALCRAVVAVYMRAVLGFLRRRAGEAGVRNGRSGAVAFVQRFGAALNLNVHVHALVLDGVFAENPDGAVIFDPLPPPGDADVGAVLAIVRHRILSMLQRRGLLDASDGFVASDALAEEAPVLAGISAASVVGSIALGPRTGARVRRCAEPCDKVEAPPPGPRHARLEGFDLHANVAAPAGHRERLERLCRYALRPPIARDRLQITADGQVVLQLRRRWSDGTTHLLFDPIELLERLAALTPRPRVNLVLYYGVLGARARWRGRIVASLRAAEARGEDRAARPEPPEGTAPVSRPHDNTRAGGELTQRDPEIRAPEGGGHVWADLMRRTFGFDVLECPRCGARMRLVATIEQRAVIERILRHLRLPSELASPWPARAPPLDPDAFDSGVDLPVAETCA